GFARRSTLAHPSQESEVGPLGGGARDRAGNRLDASGLQSTLRPQRYQPARLCSSHHVASGGRGAGKLHPRAAGDEGGPDGGIETRMKSSVFSYQSSAGSDKRRTGPRRQRVGRWISADLTRSKFYQ